jgi:hypothetical protein
VFSLEKHEAQNVMVENKYTEDVAREVRVSVIGDQKGNVIISFRVI